MLVLPRISRRQVQDIGKEPRIGWILVPKEKMHVALTDQGIEQPVVRPLGKKLRTLEGTDKSNQKFANLAERPCNQIEGRLKHRQLVKKYKMRLALLPRRVEHRVQNLVEDEI